MILFKGLIKPFKTETEYEDVENMLTPKQVLETIARIMPQDTMVCTDVGQKNLRY